MSALKQFFSDLLVIETATILAGPAVGMFLAELGATVIKIENVKSGGDATRLWKLKGENPDTDISAYFSCVNWGKKSLALDLSDQSDRQLLFDLSAKADIFLQNFRPELQSRLGLTFTELHQLNERLICAQVTAYEPGDNRPGFDAMMQAEAGFMQLNGQADGPPTKMPVALVDVLAGHQLKEAVLLALMNRTLTGQGSEVTVSLFKSGVASLINQATNYLVADVVPTRLGSDHPNVSPYGTVYQTADGKDVMLAVGTDRQFAQLCNVLGCPALVSDARFITNVQRVAHNEALKTHLEERIKTFMGDDLLAKLSRASVPAGAVRRMNEVFEHPLAQAMLYYGQLNDGQPIRGIRGISFSLPEGLKPLPLAPPPHLDEQRDEILTLVNKKRN